MKIVELTGTTDGAGALTVTASNFVNGYLEKIEYDWVDAAATTDLAITSVGSSGVSQAVLTVTNQAQADTVYYPRTPANAVADAAGFTNWAEKLFSILLW